MFHGAMKMDNSLFFVMDRSLGSIHTTMLRNEGRLTLEQILRCITFIAVYFVPYSKISIFIVYCG